MPARFLVIVNPHSAGGTTGRRAPALVEQLRQRLGEVEVEPTRGPRDAERIAREAVRAGVECLLVAGGDGTVNETVSGLLDAGLGAYARVGLLPLGSGGDLMRTLGLPRELDAAIERIQRASARLIDAGRVCYRTPEGNERSSYFVNVGSVGISGLVDEYVNRAPKTFGPKIAYALGTLRAIARWRPVQARHQIDGRLVYDGAISFATAANGRYFGSGMQVAPPAEPDDGLLDVVVVPGVSRLRLVRHFPKVYRGAHLGRFGIEHHRARRLEVESCEEVYVEIDGDPVGRLPATFEVVPKAITIAGAGT